MDYKISGLSAKPFQHLFGLPEHELAQKNVIRYNVDEYPGFPDRIEMRDAAVGKTVLLLNFQHQPTHSPYQASHAIFVSESANKTYTEVNTIPKVLSSRLQSLRGFSDQGMLIDADIANGEQELSNLIRRFFQNQLISYIHTHNAKQGCYSGIVERL